MTLHESINWFLVIWIGLFGSYCLDAWQQRWFARWSLKTGFLVSGILAAGLIVLLKAGDTAFPNWFYKLAELMQKKR